MHEVLSNYKLKYEVPRSQERIVAGRAIRKISSSVRGAIPARASRKRG